jgi:hypothetical protein
VLAILSKPSAVVFPAVLLIYEIALRKDRWIDFVKEHWLFFVLSIVVSEPSDNAFKVADTLSEFFGIPILSSEDAIKSAYKELNKRLNMKDAFVAVRSSATAEDLPGHSFAGQYETILGVTSLEHVLMRSRMLGLSVDRAGG